MSEPAPAPCDYLHSRGLILEEEGAAAGAVELQAHLQGCPSCREEHRRIAAVRQELGKLTAPGSAPHWEQAVFARIAEPPARSGRSARWWLALPVLGGALLLLLLLVDWPGQSHLDRAGPALALRFEATGETVRGAAPDEAKVGGTVEISAQGLTGHHQELRVYNEDLGLVMRCSDAPPCQRQGPSLTARWKIPAIGRYRVVALGGPTAPPPPTGSFQGDQAALQRQAAIQTVDQTIEVW